MRGNLSRVVVALAAVLACALLAGACGDSDETSTSTSTSAAGAAEQSIDAAVKSCNDQAQQLGGATGTALASACTSVGNTVKQALSAGGESVDQALSQAASSCKSAVGQLPSGQAQDALSQLCDAITSAE